MKNSFPYTALYDKLRIHGYHDDDFDKTHLAQHIPWIKRNLNFNSVLDIGCSTGGSALFLADDNVRVTGVDVSKIAVARARQLGRDVHHASATSLPFPDDSFDLVVSSDAFEHLHPRDVTEAVLEAVRVAKEYVYLRIAPREDTTQEWKQIAGHALHLTVRPIGWWKERFRPHGRIIHTEGPSFCIKLNKATTIETNDESNRRDPPFPIPHVSTFWRSYQSCKPILILGKGPSIERRPPNLEQRFDIVAVNQTANMVHGVLAVFNDYEAWMGTKPQCPVALPSRPHWCGRPGPYCLDQLLVMDYRLQALATSKQLYGFDLWTTSLRKYDYPSVCAKFSTAESAIEIVAWSGTSQVHTLGVDGGVGRSQSFHSVGEPVDYNAQFECFKDLERKYGLRIVPWYKTHGSSPI